MTLGRSHRLACAALLALAACSGHAPPGGSQADWQCSLQGRPPAGATPCGAGRRLVKGVCAPERCDDPTSALGCCPGTLCTAGGTCAVPASRVDACTTDADCTKPGQSCLERPLVRAGAKSCGYPPLPADGLCPGGQPFDGRCVGAAPCAGGCAAGRVCNVDLDSCEAPGALPGGDASCEQSCGAGSMLVYADPDAMLFAQCCAVACACEPLPGVPAGAWGRWADVAVGATDVFVSAYDSTYGDLVSARLDALGKVEQLDFVDGVPASAPVVASASGPRGGRLAPGPDVGTHTSLALAGDAPRIAYLDVDHASLRLAAWDAASGWSTSLVDDGRDGASGAPGTIGGWPSLAVDAAGLLHVTYYVHRAVRGGVTVTGAWYARSRTAAPAGYDDWDHVPVEAVASCAEACDPTTDGCVPAGDVTTCAPTRTDCSPACACDETCVDEAGVAACRPTRPWSLTAPCGGGCATDSSCVWTAGAGSTCLPSSTTCATACAADEACVTQAGSDACRPTVAPWPAPTLPVGVGLFTSLRLDAGRPVVAYHDGLEHALRGAVAAGDDPVAAGFTSHSLACEAGADLGQHASLALGPAGVAVAYQSQDPGSLWLCRGPSLATCTPELVDDGSRDAGARHLVGAYASLALDAAGEAYVAYQDQTANDLVLAYTRGGAWQRTTLASDGAHGAFARLRLLEQTAVVVDYVREQDALGNDAGHLELRLVDLTALP